MSELRVSPFSIRIFQLKCALESLSSTKGRILEIGCGRGAYVRAIKYYRPDLEVLGCDINRESIKFAQAVSKKVVVKFGNAYALPFADLAFDAVLMIDVLEHLKTPSQALSEVYRVLKPNGVFHLTVPCEGSLFTLHGWLIRFLGWKARRKRAGHVHLFTLKKLKNRLDQTGFRIVRTRWSYHLCYQVANIIYFFLLDLLKKKPLFSLGEKLSQPSTSLLEKCFISLVLKTAGLVFFLESSFLSFFPGQTVHLTCFKQ